MIWIMYLWLLANLKVHRAHPRHVHPRICDPQVHLLLWLAQRRRDPDQPLWRGRWGLWRQLPHQQVSLSTKPTPHNQINHQIDSSIEITVESELYLCAKQRTCTCLHLIFPSKPHRCQTLWAQEPPDQLFDGWGWRWWGGARRPLPRRPSHLHSCKMSTLVHTIFSKNIFLRALKAHWGNWT